MRFTKIKPLTEEEKAQKLADLREKMTSKRALKAAEEAKEAKANELIRRKAGKVRFKLEPYPPSSKRIVAHTYRQEAAQIKDDLKNKQILKDLEAKRRGSSHFPPPHLLRSLSLYHRNASFIEKENDKKAHAAVKAQIEADKRDRAQKAAQEKALREGGTLAIAPTSAPAPAAAAAAPATSSIPGREFKETRLQIRLASGGQPLTTTLPSDSSCVPYLLLRKSWPLIDFPSIFFSSSAGGGGVRCRSDPDGGR